MIWVPLALVALMCMLLGVSLLVHSGRRHSQVDVVIEELAPRQCALTVKVGRRTRHELIRGTMSDAAERGRDVARELGAFEGLAK